MWWEDIRHWYGYLCRNDIAASNVKAASQPAFTCPKLTLETLEQGVKYAQS